MSRKAFALSILVFALLLGCTRSDERTTGVSGDAPDFKLQDLNGKTVQLSDFKGKPVLLEFWATWCQPCRDSIPGMEKLHRDYAGKGLVLLAVSVDGAVEELRAFQKERGMTYTVLMGTEDVASRYGVRSIPLTIMLDKSGKIQRRWLGAGNEEDIENTVKLFL